MGNLLHAKSVYELIDGIEMNDREKAAAKAQMHRADAIVDALWSVAGGISGWVRGRPRKTGSESRCAVTAAF